MAFSSFNSFSSFIKTVHKTTIPPGYPLPDTVAVTNPFNGTNSSIVVSGEPGTTTWTSSGLTTNYLMNGSYYATGSDFYGGNQSGYGAFICFENMRTFPGSSNGSGAQGTGYWQTRTGSNTYNSDGTYGGSTTVTIDGTPQKGEWISITLPYQLVLKKYFVLSGGFDITSLIIAGSNNNTNGQANTTATWSTVDTRINTFTKTETASSTVTLSNTTGYYSYLLMVKGVTGGGSANITTWTLYA
jgi:hypothetical protein